VRKLIKKLLSIIDFIKSRKEEILFSQIISNNPDIISNNYEVEYVFLDRGDNFYRRIFQMLAKKLNSMGSPCYFLFKGKYPSGFQSLLYKNIQISETLIDKKRFRKLLSTSIKQLNLQEMTVDIENKQIKCNDINFYSIVISTLRSIHKTYTIDHNCNKVKSDIHSIIEYTKIIICYFNLIKKYQESKGCKIRFIGTEISYIPYSIIKVLCDAHNQNRSLEMINCAKGYNNYYGNHFRSTTLAAQNLTYKKVEMHFEPPENEFNSFSINCSNELKEKIYLQEKSNIINKESKINKLDLEEIINFSPKIHRKDTYLLLPHLFYDVPVNDNSTVFDSMTEWLMETVLFFNEHPNLRLLIKPHPTESHHFGYESKKPNETVESFLSKIDLSNNIEILDGGKYSIVDLDDIFDCALVWRSTAGIELAILGKPAIIAGPAPYKFMDLDFPSNRDEYFAKLRGQNIKQINNKISVNAASYLYYIRNYMHYDLGDDVVKYNIDKNRIYWSRDGIDKCMNGLNHEFNRLFERFVE